MTFAVRMNMTEAEAAALSDVLDRCPPDVVDQVMDQLWLLALLGAQRKRTPIGERRTFEARADRILEALDPRDPSERSAA